MSHVKILGFCIVGLLIAKGGLTPPSTTAADAQKLTVREETERVVLAWSGPIAKPMRDDIAAALDRYKADPRRLVLTLNSPGGSLQQGHEVMTTVRQAARLRRIDTYVENGAVCASMCVPIYLMGTERTADPDGRFMFHEVSLDPSSQARSDQKAAEITPGSRKAIVTFFTDVFYESDLGGSRVNAHWLREMRAKIVDRDVWVSARQLMDERSGVVDALVPMLTNSAWNVCQARGS